MNQRVYPYIIGGQGTAQGNARRARRRLERDLQEVRPRQVSALKLGGGGVRPLRLLFRSMIRTGPDRLPRAEGTALATAVMTTLDPKSRAASRGMSDITIRNLFIIPTILFLIVFNIFPLIYSLGYSFTDFRASTNAPANFVGLQNYRELLNDPFIWSTSPSPRNT